MPWEYKQIPEALRLPACPQCSNRGRVTMVLRGLFLCTDCIPAFAFVAVWKPDLKAVAPREERAG